MNVALHGVSFVNKGAELMLLAVMAQFNQRGGDIRLAVDLRVGSFAKRRGLGLRHYIWLESSKLGALNPLLTGAANSLPKTFRQRLDLVTDEEIDVVLDASGFSYSDQWGSRPTTRMAKRSDLWRQRGTRLILLPQALGPFQLDETANAFRTLAANTTLIYARDRMSLAYVSDLGIDGQKVQLAPDFTNLLSAINDPSYQHLRGRPCIIVNRRMLDKTSVQVRSQYLQFVHDSIDLLQRMGFKPFVLVHETRDGDLSARVARVHGIDLIREANAMKLKGIVGASLMLIGSRFHGLVSALSQNVPCLGTSWSHKYKMLFQDYECEEYLVDLADPILAQQIPTLLESLAEPESNGALRTRLKRSALRQKQASQEMWEAVFSAIGA